MTENKESLCGVSSIQKCVQKFPIVRSERAAVAAVVEAASRNDHREPILRQFRKLVPQCFFGICLLGSLPENAGVLFRLLKECAIITFRVSGWKVTLKLYGFLFKSLPAPRQDLVFTLAHFAQLLKPHAEQFLQTEFLIDGVCTVQGTAICALYTAYPGIKVLSQRMMLETAEVIQPHVGTDLELQRDLVLTELLQQACAFGASQVTGIEAVADPQCWELLPFVQCILYTANGIGYIVTQTVVLTGVNTDDETGVFACDSDQFSDYTVQFKDVVDFLTDDIRTGHIGIACNDAEAAQILRQIVAGCHTVAHNGQRCTADAGQKAQQYPGLPRNIRHDFMDLPQFSGKLRLVEQ